MIKVITPFSLLNDDFDVESGRLFPYFNVSYVDNMSFWGAQAPFLIVFTDKNP